MTTPHTSLPSVVVHSIEQDPIAPAYNGERVESRSVPVARQRSAACHEGDVFALGRSVRHSSPTHTRPRLSVLAHVSRAGADARQVHLPDLRPSLWACAPTQGGIVRLCQVRATSGPEDHSAANNRTHPLVVQSWPHPRPAQKQRLIVVAAPSPFVPQAPPTWTAWPERTVIRQHTDQAERNRH